MSKPNESNSRLYDINYYCFPFFVNKKGDYVSFYKQDKNGYLYTTRKHEIFINILKHLYTSVYKILRIEKCFIR